MDVPPLKYASASDGALIAFLEFGRGPDLLLAPHGSLGLQDEIAEGGPYFEALGENFHVVALERRGNSLSERGTADLDLDLDASDMEAVAAEAGLGEHVVYGSCMLGPGSVVYASRNQDRVTHLALWATYCSGAEAVDEGTRNSMLELAKSHPAMYARMFASNWAPDADGATLDRLARALRDQPSDIHVPRMLQAWSADLRPVLPSLAMPTLVMQRRDRMTRRSQSGEIARLAQNGRLLVFNGDDHWQWRGDYGAVVDAVSEFALGSRSADVAPASSSFQTIMFTDLESSTAMTQRLGDAGAQEVLRGHNDAVRTSLAAHGGREVKHTGDGIMAAFPSAVRAVEAALQIQRDLAGAEVRVRIGLNAGEPIAEDDDFFGTAVQLAARICDRAEPGQVLVSRVVADLCAGKQLSFQSAGEAHMKGFDEPVTLYEVGG